MKIQDYLSEDPEISGQRYALISIVGPHMPQKCDVWGLKIRGVADSLERAKALTKKIMKNDNDFDIYTVDVGKFFPLNVEPYDVADVEYENEALNALVKGYLENKELANQHWNQRKNDMMKEAIREGQKEGQEELAKKKEHPIAVLQRKKDFENQLSELRQKVESLEKDLDLTSNKFESYTQEEKELADKELLKAIENNMEPDVPKNTKSIADIRNEIMSELQNEQEPVEEKTTDPIESVLTKLQKCENEIEELHKTLSSISEETSPNIYKTLSEQMVTLEKTRSDLKNRLNDSKSVNTYINNSYESGQHDSLFE